MKRRFSAQITTLDGKPITENGANVTLGSICVNALMLPYEDERNLSGDEKMKRFKLAEKLHNAAEVDVSSEEISTVKSLIAKAYGVLVVGRAFRLLESDPEQPAEQVV